MKNNNQNQEKNQLTLSQKIVFKKILKKMKLKRLQKEKELLKVEDE